MYAIRSYYGLLAARLAVGDQDPDHILSVLARVLGGDIDIERSEVLCYTLPYFSHAADLGIAERLRIVIGHHGMIVHDSRDVEALILASAGARPAERDAVDASYNFV